MLYKELVRGPDVFCVQTVDTEHLMDEGREKDELSAMLFGLPLSSPRDPDALRHALDDTLRAVLECLQAEVGPCHCFDQTRLEWGRIIAMPPTYEGIACKRAALLYVLHSEAAVREHFRITDPALVADLQKRVLPLVVPGFVASMGQRPDAFVIMVTALCTMLPAEPMGLL